MTQLTTKIGAFDKDSRTVPVFFTSGDLTHQRAVIAVMKQDGSYDRAATKLRVAEVANGVSVKMRLGVIADR